MSTVTNPPPSILCIVDQIGGLSNGAAIRQHHLVRAVAAIGDTTVLVLDPAARGHESELAAELGAQVAVATVPTIPRTRAARRMLRHPSLPWRLARSDTERLAEVVASTVRRGRQPALLWVSSLAGWKALPPELRACSAFDLIDRPRVFHAEQLRAAGRRWRRSLGQRCRGAPLHVPAPSVTTVLKSVDGWVRGDLVERWLVGSCRLVVSCNPDERPLRADGRVQIVPNCISDPAHRIAAANRPLRLLFPAGFKYQPNLDGAEWFLTRVLPEVRRTVGPCEVVLAGSYPAGFEQMAEQHGATATGWVPDMLRLYEPGTVLIVPLLGGSGTRVKVLEAWSLGVPVIATPQGAAGLGAHDGIELLLARTPAEWGAACRRLADCGVAEALAAAGRRRFEQYFSAEVVAAHLAELLRRSFGLPAGPGCECVTAKTALRWAARQARIGSVLGATLTAGMYGGTDKVSHRYLSHYDRHLGRYLGLVVVEIGVGGGGKSDQPGGSLRVWGDYFPRSIIVGGDPTFARFPDRGTGPKPRYPGVASVAVYSGITFVEHA